MSYTNDIELMKVLESVEKEFNTHLAKAEEEFKTASLAKSEDKPFPPKDDKEPKEKEGEQKPEEKKPEGKEEGKEEPQAKEGEQPQVAQGDAQPEQKPEGQPQPQGDESHGYDDEDMQHMQKMYMSMSKAELKAHHDACRAALDSQGMQKCGDMGMAKSEDLTSIEVKIPVLEAETSLLKSELTAEKEKSAKLQKQVEAAAEFMGKLAAKKSAPQGKAITSIDVLTKSEDGKKEVSLTKTEITTILNKKAEDATLSKSDRNAINDYFWSGSKDITIVSHLLSK